MPNIHAHDTCLKVEAGRYHLTRELRAEPRSKPIASTSILCNNPAYRVRVLDAWQDTTLIKATA
jgi:hypothetical protein